MLKLMDKNISTVLRTKRIDISTYVVLKQYEGESISNQPGPFLTGGHYQDFRNVFVHHNKTYVQHFSITGLLSDNLSCLQA